MNRRIHRILKPDLELLRPSVIRLIYRLDSGNPVSRPYQFHGARMDELHGIPYPSPFETIRLRVHIPAYQGRVIHSSHHFQVSSMHIDSVVHHPFVQTILGDDRSLAGREMGSVRLCREIPRIVRPFQANGETIQRDILAHLRQEAHSLGIMNLDILQSRIHVMIQEDTGSRTFPRTHGDHRTGHQTAVFPTGRLYQPWRNLDQAPHAYRDIACIIHQMTCISLEGDTGTGSQLPAFSLRYKHAIPYLIAYPWSHLEGDPAFQRIVLHHFYL